MAARDEGLVERPQDLLVRSEVFKNVATEDRVDPLVLPERVVFRVCKVGLHDARVGAVAELPPQAGRVHRIIINENQPLAVQEQRTDVADARARLEHARQDSRDTGERASACTFDCRRPISARKTPCDA